MLRLGTVTKRVENRSGVGEGRVFIKDGFRSYRRTYRVGEVYWGIATGVALVGVVGWVTWKGAHPDPSLFDMSAALQAEPGSSPAASARGPLPAGLAAGGFREGKVGEYLSDDLYVKINGRAGFFQSFGVKSLHAVTLEAGPASEANASSIDIEVYDLGESRNAIGAYNGERPPGIESLVSDGSTFHFDRNAAFLARGAYYIRFIGSDESEAVIAEVQRLLELFRREIAGAELPWAFSLFVDQLKLSPSQVTYVKNNAFSFGFAGDVYKASLSLADSTEDIEAFVVASADAESAGALARQYQDGFGSVGVPGGKTRSGVLLSKDEFLGTFSAARATERWVVGVRGAPSAGRAEEILESLSVGIGALSPEVRARALPSADATETTEDGNLKEEGSDEH